MDYYCYMRIKVISLSRFCLFVSLSRIDIDTDTEVYVCVYENGTRRKVIVL